ncbi:hypothetical protein I3842_15G050500 [Carya illinoinensis]|uniref:Uncharacterized protein n=1 Tax=Carya illinoinensis TaxID=32201 RepID=A0A922AAM6_CARIL|nr:hypothetical protein I3842_15G050500 [Carya illinoinensis]
MMMLMPTTKIWVNIKSITYFHRFRLLFFSNTQ